MFRIIVLTLLLSFETMAWRCAGSVTGGSNFATAQATSIAVRRCECRSAGRAPGPDLGREASSPGKWGDFADTPRLRLTGFAVEKPRATPLLETDVLKAARRRIARP